MKVLYIGVFKNDKEPSIQLTFVNHLTDYGYFTKGPIAEMLSFAARTVADKTTPKENLEVNEKGWLIRSKALKEGVCGVIITDDTYDGRIAFSVVKNVVDDFVSKYPRKAYANITEESTKDHKKNKPLLPFPELEEIITKYQDPLEADNIAKIQKELDDTKVVIHKTIESVLERGEKLDSLVAKSEGLSAQSKMFYTQAKKQNSCCIVM